MVIFHSCVPRSNAEVDGGGVQAPLVGSAVVGGLGAAVIPQPHVVQPHLRPSVVELWSNKLWFKNKAAARKRTLSCIQRAETVVQEAENSRSRRGAAAARKLLGASGGKQQLGPLHHRSHFSAQRPEHHGRD